MNVLLDLISSVAKKNLYNPDTKQAFPNALYNDPNLNQPIGLQTGENPQAYQERIRQQALQMAMLGSGMMGGTYRLKPGSSNVFNGSEKTFKGWIGQSGPKVDDLSDPKYHYNPQGHRWLVPRTNGQGGYTNPRGLRASDPGLLAEIINLLRGR